MRNRLPAMGWVLAVLFLFIPFVPSARAEGREVWAVPPTAAAYSPEEQALRDAHGNGSLIRLHILAEDDTPRAQATKLAVRDAILRAFSRELTGDNADTLYLALQRHVEEMRAVAEETARSLGFDGQVSAEVGVLPLPEKRYGQVLLPPGEYRALRITLGQGQGQNWWCVLYPSLCLAVADDEPWRIGEKAEAARVEETPRAIGWDAGRILAEWLVWPVVP